MKTEVLERFADIVLPLAVMSIYLTVSGKGFLTMWPIIGCTAYAIAQPFLRFFVLEKVREPLLRADKAGIFLTGAALMYSALAMSVVELMPV